MKVGKKIGSKKRFSIKYKMMLLCLSSIIITVTAISLTTMPRILRELRQATEDHMNNFIVDHSEKIVRDTEDMFDRVRMISNTTDQVMKAYREAMASQDEASYTALQARQDAFHEDLKRYSEKSEYQDVIYVITADGTVIGASDGTNGGEKISEDMYSGISVEEGKISVESSYNEETNTVSIKYVNPTYENGSVAGYTIYIRNSLELDKIVDNYTLIGIEQPRISLADKNGMILAHSLDERIGTDTTNETLLEELKEIRNGSCTDEGAQSTKYNSSTDGNAYTLSYICLPDTDWLLSISVPDSVLYSNVNSIIRFYMASTLAVSMLALIGIVFMVTSFIKPIVQISNIITTIGELDYTIDVEEEQFHAICKRNDEIGDMGRSVEAMVLAVKGRLQTVLQSSEEVNQAAARLKEITTDISEKATDTSATTEELSAGMEETASGAEVLLNDVNTIQDDVTTIKEQISTNTNVTLEIMTRAERMRKESAQSEQNTRTTFEEIKKKGAIAMEQSKATAQINELAQVIMDIADQTSLLALNAAIEAARAGESGKGFAVVADEIGNLAQQSSDTVNKISGIVESVNEAVRNITQCLTDSQKFVEDNVYRDYAIQLETLESYSKDAENIHSTMNEIDGSTKSLYVTMQRMIDAISGASQTIQELSIGIADIAEKNNEIGNLTNESYQMVNDTNRISGELEESILAFKLS